jgi:hypothetical protein
MGQKVTNLSSSEQLQPDAQKLVGLWVESFDSRTAIPGSADFVRLLRMYPPQTVFKAVVITGAKQRTGHLNRYLPRLLSYVYGVCNQLGKDVYNDTGAAPTITRTTPPNTKLHPRPKNLH